MWAESIQNEIVRLASTVTWADGDGMSLSDNAQRILHLLDETPASHTTGELAKRVHLSASTTRKHLRNLVFQGLVVRQIEAGVTMDTFRWSKAEPSRGLPPACQDILCRRCVIEIYEDDIRYIGSMTAEARSRRLAWKLKASDAMAALGENETAPAWLEEGPCCGRCGSCCGSIY